MKAILYAAAVLRWASSHQQQLQQISCCLQQDWIQVQEVFADFPVPDEKVASPRSVSFGMLLHWLPQIEAVVAAGIAVVESPGPLTIAALVQAGLALVEAIGGAELSQAVAHEMRLSLPAPQAE